MTRPPPRPPPGSPLPPRFLERLRAQLGTEEAAAVAHALDTPAVQGLRAHPRHGTAAALAARRGWAGAPVPWCEEGIALDPVGPGRHPAGRHPWQDAGAYYLQDPAAMGVVPLLDLYPGAWVLDLAAAPGGKSTQIAGALGDRGLLWSHDATPTRADALVANLERWGASVAVVSQGDSAPLRALAGRFDRVLVDAPCSGEAMFRTSEAARRRWSPNRVATCATIQAGLLDLAADLLRPGGLLVYATCTFSPEEDEGTIEGLLLRRRDLEAKDLGADRPAGTDQVGRTAGPVAAAAVRWWPHRTVGNGHFAARLQRLEAGSAASRGATATRSRAGPIRARDAAAGRGRRTGGRVGSPSLGGTFADVDARSRSTWASFADETLGGDPLPGHVLRLVGDRLIALPEPAADLAPTWRMAGVPLGRVRGDRLGRLRFEPHHALSRVLPRLGEGAVRLDLADRDPRVDAYLAGGALTAAGIDGWGLVRVDGAPLGWVKGRSGELNNHYPRGLRRQRDADPAEVDELG